MISEILIKKIVDLSVDKLKKYLESVKKQLVAKPYDLQNAISQHEKSVEIWSSQIAFRGIKNAKETTNTYIELNLLLTPRRSNISESSIDSKSFKEVFQNEESHIVILGQPGAGKTTTMKQICQELLYSEDTVFTKYNFPVVIRLRELDRYRNIDNPLIMKIYTELSLAIDFNGKEDKNLINHIIINSTSVFLDSLGAILILDGFDEIQDHSLKRSVIEDIRMLSLNVNNSKVILTSRTADYNVKIDNTCEYELDSLSDSQIKLFISRWLKDDESTNHLFSLLKASPFYDTTVRPLTLAHLCAIYELDKKIPARPKYVYKKIIDLLLIDWSRQWSVLKNSRYSNFEPERKFEFLSRLAYFLTVEFGKTIFSKDELGMCYTLICSDFGLPPSDLNAVVDELESHNGLLLQAGYDSYEFAHKSLQEYLTADYINRLPFIPTERNILLSLPNELAIATSLSSNETTYFISLVDVLKTIDLESLEFISIFINRISLERPNFKYDIRLGMAALYLFTLYTDKYIDVSREEYNAFIESFKRLIQLAPIYHSIRDLVVSKGLDAQSKYIYEFNYSNYDFDEEYYDEYNNIRFIRKPEDEEDHKNKEPRYIYYNCKLMN